VRSSTRILNSQRHRSAMPGQQRNFGKMSSRSTHGEVLSDNGGELKVRGHNFVDMGKEGRSTS
jgi:hypothetical protein